MGYATTHFLSPQPFGKSFPRWKQWCMISDISDSNSDSREIMKILFQFQFSTMTSRISSIGDTGKGQYRQKCGIGPSLPDSSVFLICI